MERGGIGQLWVWAKERIDALQPRIFIYDLSSHTRALRVCVSALAVTLHMLAQSSVPFASQMAPPEEESAREAVTVGSPKALNPLVALPFMSGLLDGQRVMRHAVQNAVALLNGRVDPHIAAPDQAIPTWVLAKAKARAPQQQRSVQQQQKSARSGAALPSLPLPLCTAPCAAAGACL